MKSAQYLAFATVLMTMVLIAAGVLVRATGSGLGCPDWPTCHGTVVPPGDHHGIIEISHRYLGTLVGLLVIGAAVMAWLHFRHVPFITAMATLAVPLVGIQGLLGAVAVVRELPPEVVATHLVTAMLVLTVESLVAWGMFLEDRSNRDIRPERHRATARAGAVAGAAAMAWLAVVMWVGGYMAESGAATACEGWPLCNGSPIPAADGQEFTHMLHRYLAGAFIFFIAVVVTRLWRARGTLPYALPSAIALAVLYVAQVAVGALNVVYTFPDALTVTHTVIASAVWLTLSAVVILGFYSRAAERSRTPGLKAGEATA